MSEPAELHPEHNVLIRKLRSISPLTDDEKQCLATLPFSTRSVGADQDIVREGDRPSECCLVVEGFLCRYKLTEKGKRQIFSFHLPGDIPDLQSLHLKVMDHSLMTLTPCKLAFIPHESLTRVHAQVPARRRFALARHPDRRRDVPRVDDGHGSPLGSSAHRARSL